MTILATVYLDRANSFMILAVLTAVSESDSLTSWYRSPVLPDIAYSWPMTHVEHRPGLNAKQKNPYPAREWCVWYDFGVYDMISVENNAHEISGLHNI